jgi:ABC-2 type transport system permease protein
MNAWQITKKDVRLLVRDRRTLFVLVVLPMSFITILGASTGQLFSAAEKNRSYRIGVVDECDSVLSRKIISETEQIRAMQLVEYKDRAAARRALATEGGIDLLLVIGPTFEERVDKLDLSDVFGVKAEEIPRRLRALDIEVEAGSILANAAQIVDIVVYSFTIRSVGPTVLKREEPTVALKLLRKIRQHSEDAEEKLEATIPPSAGAPKSFNAQVYQMLVPSYTVMFVFFIVNFMSRSFIAERDIGTLNRLRIAPVTRSGLMMGKTVPFFLISLGQTALLFTAGRLLFGMSWGTHPWLLLPVMVSTSMAATSLGLLVATSVRTDSQVSAYGNFLVLTMAGISGCLMPRVWLPASMKQISLVTPHAWSLIAYDQVLDRSNPEMTVIWQCCGILAAFAVVYFLIGWWRFRTMD